MATAPIIVCGICGTTAARNRNQTLVHTDDVGREFEEHDAAHPMSQEIYERLVGEAQDLRTKAADMLVHHGTMHPSSECEWSQRLASALKS